MLRIRCGGGAHCDRRGDLHTHNVGAGAGRIGEVERHRRERVHAGHAEIPGKRRRPVFELTEQEQRSICTYTVEGKVTEIPQIAAGPGITPEDAGL